MSIITRSMAKKMAVAEVILEDASEPSPWPSITDVAPEVLEMILKNLDCGRNSMLPYRLVSSLWKSIIDDLLEKKTLKGDIDACPTLQTSYGGPKVNCPDAMIRHTGNPFPSSSLVVANRLYSSQLKRYLPFRYNLVFRLYTFMSKVGFHLTTFLLYNVRIKSDEYLCKTLAHLPNLKTLKIQGTLVPLKDEEPFGCLPVLPRLTRLELISNFGGSSDWKSVKFCSWFVDAYAEQLHYLELKLVIFKRAELDPLPPASPESSPMQQLRQLKIFRAGPKFFQLSCSPPLKHLYIGMLFDTNVMSLAVLMTFVNKFSQTLETLNLDIKWSELSQPPRRVGEDDENQLDALLKRFYRPNVEAIGTGRRRVASTVSVVFPKLTKLTLPYPSNVVESAIISEIMLPQFPALRELKFGYFEQVVILQNLDTDEFRQTNGPRIKEWLKQEGYWKLCSKLTLISVWLTGEESWRNHPNFMVFSSRKEDIEK